MISEKIDHHFNELSPIDFNIFQDMALCEKLEKEQIAIDKAKALLDHIKIIKEQIESVLNEEDEQLAVVYNFLSNKEQTEYLNFLSDIEKQTSRYISKIN